MQACFLVPLWKNCFCCIQINFSQISHTSHLRSYLNADSFWRNFGSTRVKECFLSYSLDLSSRSTLQLCRSWFRCLESVKSDLHSLWALLRRRNGKAFQLTLSYNSCCLICRRRSFENRESGLFYCYFLFCNTGVWYRVTQK